MVDMIPTMINNRWELLLPEHRAARPEWPTWEAERLAHMHSTTKPQDMVYYIGGEEGDMAALLCSWGAEVFIAEPNELVWPNIRAIWDANKLTQPEATYVGFVGGECSPGWVDGLHFDGWPFCSTGDVIGDHGFKELSDPGERPVITIDELAQQIAVPDMISMDVEGSEWDVLQGAKNTIIEHKPSIYLSLHPESVFRLYGLYAADVRNWIKSFGYTETFLAYDHECHLVYEPA